MGGLATIWRGSAFNCEDSANMIVLLHSQFRPSSMAKTCNNGVISGRGVRVVNSFYTSQLSIKISFDLIGKTIECAQSGQLGASASEMINETTSKFRYNVAS